MPGMTFITSFVSLSHVSPNDDGIYILNILGDDQRPYIEDDLRDLLTVVLPGKIGDGFDH